MAFRIGGQMFFEDVEFGKRLTSELQNVVGHWALYFTVTDLPPFENQNTAERR